MLLLEAYVYAWRLLQLDTTLGRGEDFSLAGLACSWIGTKHALTAAKPAATQGGSMNRAAGACIHLCAEQA